MSLRAVIVDDSDMDRFNLRILLKHCDGVQCVAECGTPALGVEVINRERPEVVFLDVQMPGASGFDVLTQLAYAPNVVFVTAFSDYAIRAFEVNAVDYLLKPILLDRLQRALARLLVPATAVSPLPVRTLTLEEPIFLRSGTRQFFVPVSKIIAVCAAGDYSEVRLHGQPPLEIRRRMSEWMAVLPGDSFLQIDRSLIVNRLLIRGVERLSRTNGRILMDGIAAPLQTGRAGLERLSEAFQQE